MKPEYIVYIDESGDEGFKFQDGEKGSSRWFVLSAVVVRKVNDIRLVQVAKEARKSSTSRTNTYYIFVSCGMSSGFLMLS